MQLSEKRFQPDLAYAPLVYYDRFKNYYYQTYDFVYRPGYFAVNSTYFLEVNYYELEEGFLV